MELCGFGSLENVMELGFQGKF